MYPPALAVVLQPTKHPEMSDFLSSDLPCEALNQAFELGCAAKRPPPFGNAGSARGPAVARRLLLQLLPNALVSFHSILCYNLRTSLARTFDHCASGAWSSSFFALIADFSSQPRKPDSARADNHQTFLSVSEQPPNPLPAPTRHQLPAENFFANPKRVKHGLRNGHSGDGTADGNKVLSSFVQGSEVEFDTSGSASGQAVELRRPVVRHCG